MPQQWYPAFDESLPFSTNQKIHDTQLPHSRNIRRNSNTGFQSTHDARPQLFLFGGLGRRGSAGPSSRYELSRQAPLGEFQAFILSNGSDLIMGQAGVGIEVSTAIGMAGRDCPYFHLDQIYSTEFDL